MPFSNVNFFVFLPFFSIEKKRGDILLLKVMFTGNCLSVLLELSFKYGYRLVSFTSNVLYSDKHYWRISSASLKNLFFAVWIGSLYYASPAAPNHNSLF